MPKWAKTILAVLLLPVCVGACGALLRVVRQTGHADTFWAAFGGGAASWLSIYLLLPKPMLIYVFGHELTHALWTWVFGGRVKRFKVSAGGGQVVVTRSNFLIVLAPYFFPVYAVLLLVAFGLGHFLWNWHRLAAVFHLLLGAAYAFHVTLTWHILQHRQTDITQQGRLFSAVIIFLGNVAVLLLGLPLLAGRPGPMDGLKWWMAETGTVLQRLAGLLP